MAMISRSNMEIKEFEIPKKSGGVRRITAPTGSDRNPGEQ
jgi:hypothetical protein